MSATRYAAAYAERFGCALDVIDRAALPPEEPEDACPHAHVERVAVDDDHDDVRCLDCGLVSA